MDPEQAASECGRVREPTPSPGVWLSATQEFLSRDEHAATRDAACVGGPCGGAGFCRATEELWAVPPGHLVGQIDGDQKVPPPVQSAVAPFASAGEPSRSAGGPPPVDGTSGAWTRLGPWEALTWRHHRELSAQHQERETLFPLQPTRPSWLQGRPERPPLITASEPALEPQDDQANDTTAEGIRRPLQGVAVKVLAEVTCPFPQGPGP